MSYRKSDLDNIIDNLCKNKDKDYKTFIKNIVQAMSKGNKWDKLSEVAELNQLLKKKKN
tara:strand:- start:933 stop:1109 length:177 start_codon:yes stop_codon:yes gene_type:complete